MCNIAGYVGTRPASPILLEMMRREEGFAGGYYSGIATVHEGAIRYAKLTGDVQMLIDHTDAASLPGTVGILHSRSKSGGGDEWAHPFVGRRNGEIVTAYVANGSAGHFSARSAEYCALTERLLAAGYRMDSRVQNPNRRYQNLSDGTTVHMSDVMCQLILRNLDNGEDEASAMAHAFCEMPSEIVGLMLSLQKPDAIFWSRINMPMMIGFAPHGVYLASTALAFPEDAENIQILPACAGGCVSREGYTVVPYKAPPASVAPIDARVVCDAYACILALLQEGEMSFSALSKAVAPLFDEADCKPSALLAYEVLRAMQKQGILKITSQRVPGVLDRSDIPAFRMHL